MVATSLCQLYMQAMTKTRENSCVILKPSKRVGRIVQPHHFADIIQCTKLAGIADLIYRGYELTGNNNQEDMVYSKIDRVTEL